MDSFAFTLALITALLTAIGTPIVVAFVQARKTRLDADISAKAREAEIALAAKVRREEKEDEWRRADLLEKRAADRAAAVAKRADETAEILIGATRDVQDKTAAIGSDVKEIHALSNSSYTAALQAALEAVQAKLAVLMEGVDFRRQHSLEVSTDITEDIATTRLKMEELSSVISKRLQDDALAKETKAKELLLAKQAAAAPTTASKKPLPVTDDRVAAASERSADALEESAAANKRAAAATERTSDAVVAGASPTTTTPSKE